MKNILILFFVIPLFAFAQIRKDYQRNYNDTLLETYKLDVSKLRDHIYNGFPKTLKYDIYEKISYFYANNVAYEISELISDGSNYSDWSEMENYLNEILLKVMPPELKGDSVIHVYIRQDGNYNAFMTPSGHMFLNIGIFSEVYNESNIAGILVHELAHYYLKHSVNDYIEHRTGEHEGMLFNKNILNKYSIIREKEADSLAIKWIYDSGYNINGLLFTFQTLERLETNILSRLENKLELDPETHPLAEDRVAKINAFLAKHKGNEGQFFLVNQDLFYKLKTESKPEILKALMSDYDYADCIEQAFKFHIFDPDNIIYVNYLMESIRRNCYMDKSLWDKLFISYRYFEKYESNGKTYKQEIIDHLFKKFNFDILPMDVRIAGQIKAKFYWKDVPKFTTNKEAFEFFYKLSQALNDHECELSKALSITHDNELRNKYLETYLGFEDVKYKAFAKSLLKDSIYSSVSNKKLLVFSTLGAIIKYKNEEIPVRNFALNPKNEISFIFDSVSLKFENRIPLFLPGLKNYSLNDFKTLKKLENLTFIYTVSKGDKAEIYILDPEIWEVFVKYNVNEIEFLNSIYTETQIADKSIDAYKKLMESNFDEIFSKTLFTKHLETFISSVRIIKNTTMKSRYYSGTSNLKFKNSGYSEIISDLIAQIYNKEKHTETMDYYNSR